MKYRWEGPEWEVSPVLVPELAEPSLWHRQATRSCRPKPTIPSVPAKARPGRSF